eukprot:CAMPEP_0117467782 /NCGR_PEP_ID=MMETSP0784-20121206/5835_1 /TAXON_ID=39447 /ORGANISM="" /LENGTH=176 /DNA_ID=CAMNT_0005261765 /DNA_START=934 /DNA_END=1465 /DNA_ORIENTATION=+
MRAKPRRIMGWNSPLCWPKTRWGKYAQMRPSTPNVAASSKKNSRNSATWLMSPMPPEPDQVARVAELAVEPETPARTCDNCRRDSGGTSPALCLRPLGPRPPAVPCCSGCRCCHPEPRARTRDSQRVGAQAQQLGGAEGLSQLRRQMDMRCASLYASRARSPQLLCHLVQEGATPD